MLAESPAETPASPSDVDPENVAQDIALQYFKRLTDPISLFGWADTANRCRLIDLARKNQPVKVEHDELFRQRKH